MTKVGDTLYHAKTWAADKWFSEKIIGETRMSWLLKDNRKVNKKTMQESQGDYSPLHWYTARGRDDFIWISNNAQRIGSAVSGCRERYKLERIAAIVGVKLI